MTDEFSRKPSKEDLDAAQAEIDAARATMRKDAAEAAGHDACTCNAMTIPHIHSKNGIEAL
jgi:hypothetical protein